MVFRVFIFILLLRTNGKKEHLDENDFRHSYVFFFRKCRFESYFITEMFTGLSQQLRDTLKTEFERQFTVEDFTEMD